MSAYENHTRRGFSQVGSHTRALSRLNRIAQQRELTTPAAQARSHECLARYRLALRLGGIGHASALSSEWERLDAECHS